MNRKSIRAIFLGMALLLLVIGCGVRGRPQPPERPAFIGRGSPQILVEPNLDDKVEKSVPKQSK